MKLVQPNLCICEIFAKILLKLLKYYIFWHKPKSVMLHSSNQAVKTCKLAKDVDNSLQLLSVSTT